jgi:magnesium-transporting ATPase (P-type)
MSAFEMKNVSSTASQMDLLPELPSRKPRRAPAPPSAPPVVPNIGRRQSSLNAVRRSIGIVDPDISPNDTMRRNSVAWQTMSQNLNLQLEQHRRKSELNSRRLPSLSAPDERQDHVTVPIDDEKAFERTPSLMVADKPPAHRPSAADSILEFEKGATEDTSLLKTDVHIVPMATLVERFSSDLQSGLTNDTVEQHRAKFGQNKLTPPPKPSLIWMFFKQILIGFNGILWVATLFAFLSYVSFCYILVKNKLIFHY